MCSARSGGPIIIMSIIISVRQPLITYVVVVVGETETETPIKDGGPGWSASPRNAMTTATGSIAKSVNKDLMILIKGLMAPPYIEQEFRGGLRGLV